MPGPVPLEPQAFFEFITRSEISVVMISIHRAHTFSQALYRRFACEAPGAEQPACAVMDLLDLVVFQSPVLTFLQHSLSAQGVQHDWAVPAGYWLFRAGRVAAWHSGLPSTIDVRDLIGGALLGTLMSSATANPEFLLKGLYYAAEEATARQIAECFREALQGHMHEQRRPSGPRPSASPNDLQRAYDLLGVARTASDAELNRAWRRRRIEVHPDLAAADPAEFARRSRVSAELNWARDVIVQDRARQRACN